MADKVPIRTVFDSGGNATGLAEFQSGETVGFAHGGTGLSSLGTAGQFLQVNSGASALEFTSDINVASISPPSGNITLDSAADIILDADGADITLKDGGTTFGSLTNSSGELVIKSGSTPTTAITMSGANVTVAGNLTVSGTTTTVDSTTVNIQNQFVFEGGTDDSFETTLTTVDPTADRTVSLPNATTTLVGQDTTDTLTNKTLTTPVIAEIDTTGDFTLDSAGAINLDAASGVINFKDDGTKIAVIENSSSNLAISADISDKDILFKGNDGGSTITALTLDMSDAGSATFNNNVTVGGNLTVTGTTTFNGGTINLGDAATDTVAFNGTVSTDIVFEGSSADSFETTLRPGNPSADIVLTLPSDATTTLVGLTNTQTLTNKTLTSPVISTISNSGTVTVPTGTRTLVARDTTDTLTNKTLTSPTINTPTVSGLTLSDSSVVFEGSTADSFETTLTVTDPTADRTITLPNATGTLIAHGQFSGDLTVASNGAVTLATVNSDTSAVGSTTQIPVITANAKGLVTSIGTAAISTVLTVSADSGSNDSVTVGTDTLNFEGGDNLTTTVSNNNIKVDLAASPALTSIVFEGSTADSFETTLAVTDPTADRTITLPNKTGTVAMTTDTAFPESTLAAHPAASGNVDLAGGSALTAATVDAFGIAIADLFDQMEPRGRVDTVDLGSVA